jgi:uncharacterized membrane protein YdjX (TVP38/TMEM64 family)
MVFIESYITTVPVPLAVLVSVLLNIVISIVGVFPSAFLTAINVTVFGFWGGFWVSLFGEVVGSLVAFWLYRKGFRKFIGERSKHSPRVLKLVHATTRDAFLFVIGLRLIPFVPSGLVTLYAAVGSMSFVSFAVASSLGKVPALFIEVSAVNAVVNWTGTGKWVIAFLAIGLLYYGLIRMKK